MRSLIPTATCGLFLLLLLAGCVTWQKGGATYTNAEHGYSLTPPPDWWFHPRLAGAFVATHDGPLLQQLRVDILEAGKPLPHNKRALPDQGTPFELAELLADDLQADRQRSQLAIKENQPTTFGTQPGFKLVIEYVDDNQLRMTEIIHGALVKKKLFLLIYEGPSRHFLPRDRAAVEATAQSWRFPS